MVATAEKKKAQKVRPSGNRVLIVVDEAHETTTGGIVLPDQAKEKPQRGKVVAVGEGERLESGELAPPNVRAGDSVIFGRYDGTEIKVDEQTYLIVDARSILAVVES